MTKQKVVSKISIKDVDCEFVWQEKHTHVIHSEDLKTMWQDLSEEEKSGWYTTKKERRKLDAVSIMEYVLEREMEDGYEEMNERCFDSISDENFAKLQEIFDDIAKDSAFEMHVEDKVIIN